MKTLLIDPVCCDCAQIASAHEYKLWFLPPGGARGLVAAVLHVHRRLRG